MGKKVLWVSPDFFQRIVTEGYKMPSETVSAFECLHGLPVNACFLKASYVPERDQLCMLFASDDWPEQEAGAYLDSVVVEMRETVVIPPVTEMLDKG